MPNTRASTRRRASVRRLSRRAHSATNDDGSVDNSVLPPRDDVEVEPGTSIMDHLREVESGVEALNAKIRSLQQEIGTLRAKPQRAQRNIRHNTKSGSATEKATRRQIQLLERTIVDLKAAGEKDKRTIEQLRDREVRWDADELAGDHGAATTQETELGEKAIELLRRLCDAIDMNTLAEGEECAICMEEMAGGKCYSLPCRHPVCVGCFERLGDGSNATADHQTKSVQCPHCRETCQREECEIITHTAVQQWDLLLDISQEWVTMDVGEVNMGEDDDEESFIDNNSVAPPESPQSLGEPVGHDPEVSTASTSPNDTGPVAYKSLPSPLKRKRLTELAAQRAVKQRV